MGVLQANQKSSIAPDGEGRATCSVDWSPNEDRFAMGGKSKILRVVSTDGQQQWSGSGHTDWIRALRWAPEGGFIVTGSDDRTARIWDESSGKCTKTLKGGHSDWIRSLDASPSGEFVATGGDDKKVVLWNVSSGAKVWSQQKHTGFLYALRFSPDGEQLASGGGGDKALRIWNVSNGSVTRTLKGHNNDVRGICWSPDGDQLASVDTSGTMIIWDPSNGSIQKRVSGLGTGYGVAWSPDGELLVVASSNGAIVVGAEDHKIQEKVGASTSSVAFSVSGDQLVAGLDAKGARTFSVDGAGAPISSGGSSNHWRPTLPNGRGRCLGLLEVSPDLEPPAVALTADGKTLAIGGGGQVSTWSLDGTPRQLHQWNAHDGQVHCVTWSKDASLIASTGENQLACIWKVSSRECLQVLQGHEGPVLSASFSPNGKQLATSGADGTVRIWDVRTGTCSDVLDTDGSRSRAVAWAPNGKLLAAATDDGAVFVWNNQLEVQEVLRGHSGWVHSIAWSPNSKTLTSSGEDMCVRIWDLKKSTSTVMEGHQGAVTGVTCSSDGAFIATAGGDQTVRSWDPRRGKERSKNADKEGYPQTIAGSAGFYVTGHTDGFIFAWAY